MAVTLPYRGRWRLPGSRPPRPLAARRARPGKEVMELRSRTTAVLAWSMWLVAFGCCAGGLLVTLAIYRPLTVAVLVEGAIYAFFFVLGFATVGLVLALQRPGNPIGWLYGAAGLAWAYRHAEILGRRERAGRIALSLRTSPQNLARFQDKFSGKIKQKQNSAR